jgi:SAM-dependent methyltransferase
VADRSKLERHYGGNGLVARLDDALSKAGLASRRLSPIDLAPLDQFHARGLAATIELAEMAAVRSGERVIDIGSGLGGPSRYLAAKYDCRVFGVDLSSTFVEASTFLAERTGSPTRSLTDAPTRWPCPSRTGTSIWLGPSTLP